MNEYDGKILFLFHMLNPRYQIALIERAESMLELQVEDLKRGGLSDMPMAM